MDGPESEIILKSTIEKLGGFWRRKLYKPLFE
jgi:hypothetical protein